MDDVCEMVCRISRRVHELWLKIFEELRPWRYLDKPGHYSWDLAKKIKEELNRLNDELSSIVEEHPEIAKKIDLTDTFSDIQTCLDYVNLPTKKILILKLENYIKISMFLVSIAIGETIVLVLSTFMLKPLFWWVVGALTGTLVILFALLHSVHNTLIEIRIWRGSMSRL